jgi:hypothetical protein
MEEEIRELAKNLYRNEVEGLNIDLSYQDAVAIAKWHLEAVKKASLSCMVREEGQQSP